QISKDKSVGVFKQRVRDSIINQWWSALNEALQADSDNAEWFCQRAYAHILLKNYSCDLCGMLLLAVCRIAEYHLNSYESAHAAFTQGRQLDGEHQPFWPQPLGGEDEVTLTASMFLCVRHDWYQTESQVIVTIMAKNVPRDGVRVSFMEREVCATVQLASGENYELHLRLLHPIVPQQSSFKVLTTKVCPGCSALISLLIGASARFKTSPIETLSICSFPSDQYPTSEEEKNEKLEGDAVKRAMNKSFMESGGTVLSTNWMDVGRRKVDVSPPDDVEFKKY
uniref:SGT1 homolog, MIS12 kinetochore complex assembly cochaperone n=1 Tax=Salarias fasciatus TaxID=181472 RepID=A0A672HXA7_SALFA